MKDISCIQNAVNFDKQFRVKCRSHDTAVSSPDISFGCKKIYSPPARMSMAIS